MRVWLYARLSNDDDREMNSLLNQQEICHAYAEKQGYIVVVDTSAVEASALLKLRCYLAGAMYALNAHIVPVDGNVFVFSVEEFDVQEFIGKHS